jgi:hypothetical protein
VVTAPAALESAGLVSTVRMPGPSPVVTILEANAANERSRWKTFAMPPIRFRIRTIMIVIAVAAAILCVVRLRPWMHPPFIVITIFVVPVLYGALVGSVPLWTYFLSRRRRADWVSGSAYGEETRTGATGEDRESVG